MRFTRMAVCGLITCLAYAGRADAGVPIDRPSPPPYCADGKCYPKTSTWGYYQGRWRRWPELKAAPTEAEPTPAELLGPDLPPYEAPSPEYEDRAAPPPTMREEAESTVAPPRTLPTEEEVGPMQPAPGMPPGPRRGTSPEGEEEEDSPPLPPFGTTPPATENVPLPPFGTTPPATENVPLLPFGSPSGGGLPGNVPGDEPIPPELHLYRTPHRVPSPVLSDPPPPLPGSLRGLVSR